jgi:Type I phosphodiesterase / nucleotide pyrophosphatase
LTVVTRLFLALLLVGLLAPSPAAAKYARPLVYVVVIDGLDGDRVDDGQAAFISSLLSGQGARATYYRESRSVMLAETNPNHTAMMTGAYGGQSGIPGNAFALYAPLENPDSCKATGPVDESKPPTVTSGENANCPVAQMTFESIKRQGNPDDLISAGIFGKPKLGRIFAGRNYNAGARDVDHLWAPCDDAPDDDGYCGDVNINPVSGYAFDDSLVMDEVVRSATEGARGRGGRRPDFTFVNLHQVDTVGHATMPGFLYSLAIGQADDQVERLVSLLRARGEWNRTVLILLSDHSMDGTLQKTSLTSTLSAAGIPESAFVAVQNGSAEHVYLANRTDPARFALLARMRQAVLANSSVSEALYRESNPADGGQEHTLEAVHPDWNLAGVRTGDLVVMSRPGTAFTDPEFSSNPLPGNHGGPHTRDNFFAVIGGGDFVRQQTVQGLRRFPGFDDTRDNPGQAENVDVGPTVMGLLGLFAPGNSRGRFLSEAFDISKLPGGAAPSARPRIGLSRSRTRARGRVVYRVRFSPAGGSYDLDIKSRGRYRRVVSRGQVTSYTLRARRKRNYRLRLRMISASGVPSGWTVRRLRVPRR